MSLMRKLPAADHAAITMALFLRLFGVLEMQEAQEPDAERATILRRIRPLRNKLAHGAHATETYAELQAAIPELLDYLQLVEQSSLGGEKARYLRLLSSSEEINDVLSRSAQREADRLRPERHEADDLAGPGKVGSALVAAAVRGDRDAMEQIVRNVRPLVQRYCRARVGRQERSFASADDVAQEVCLSVLTSLPTYRDQGRPFMAFVYGIAARKVADAHRSAARNRSGPEVPDGPETHVGPEQRAMQGELTVQMAQLLRLLPEKQREILMLRIVAGLSAEETATITGTTPGAVRVAQHRALSRLRRLVEAESSTAASP